MRTSTFVIRLSASLCGFAALAFAQTPATPCENLKSLTITGLEFSAVETVAAGPYQPPAGAGRGAGGPAALNNPAPANGRGFRGHTVGWRTGKVGITGKRDQRLKDKPLCGATPALFGRTRALSPAARARACSRLRRPPLRRRLDRQRGAAC